MKQWEYKEYQEHISIEVRKLRKLGEDGWEMCAAFQIGSTEYISYTFKRQLVTKPEEKI